MKTMWKIFVEVTKTIGMSRGRVMHRDFVANANMTLICNNLLERGDR
jgi:hypothetical protein